NSLTHERIQLGATITQGLGAGSNPQVGKAAAEESQDKIKDALKGVNLLFIAAGMGGGTGTGASPVIAKIAKEMGILTVAVVTKPFRMEGQKRMRVAEAGIEELSKYVDTILTIPNQNLFLVANAKMTIREAFKVADNILYQAVKSITDLMITTMDIHVDFADFCTVTKGMGKAIMGSGEAEGENRALEATERAITNPLLDVSMKGAKGVLISLSGKEVGLWEADEAVARIQQEVDEDANIIFGICADDAMGDKIRVSVVATGLNQEKVLAPEMIRYLQDPQKTQTIIVPNENNNSVPPQQEEKKPEPSVIFVPANKQDKAIAEQISPISLSEEIQSVQEKTQDNFVPSEPVNVPVDEKELEKEQTTIDLFDKVIDDLDKDISAEKKSSEKAETKPDKAKEEEVSFWKLFPGLWNDKKIDEEAKKRLQPENNSELERKIPTLPSEEELGIPAFFNESKPV
ncbi:MAG: cell division protein FtsZ, partial [Alphaproteobacteria bacterium]